MEKKEKLYEIEKLIDGQYRSSRFDAAFIAATNFLLVRLIPMMPSVQPLPFWPYSRMASSWTKTGWLSNQRSPLGLIRG